MNNWNIGGRVGRDAETKVVGDSSVTSFAVAVDKRVRGEKVTDWIDCSLWGERGDKVAPYITKGSTLSVAGEAGARSYEKDGQTRTVMTLRVRELTLLGKGQDSGNTSSSGSRGGAPQRERPAPATKAPADDFEDDIPF